MVILASGTTVWLSEEKTSPYNFYQYWIRDVEDADIGKCLRYLTEFSHEEIESLEAGDPRDAKKALAGHMTQLVHGERGLKKAEAATQILFGKEVTKDDADALASIAVDVPNGEIPKSDLESGVNVIDAFVASPLAKSKGEARRTLEQGGIYVNNVRISELDFRLTSNDLIGDDMILLRSGKKKYAVLRLI